MAPSENELDIPGLDYLDYSFLTIMNISMEERTVMLIVYYKRIRFPKPSVPLL